MWPMYLILVWQRLGSVMFFSYCNALVWIIQSYIKEAKHNILQVDIISILMQFPFMLFCAFFLWMILYVRSLGFLTCGVSQAKLINPHKQKVMYIFRLNDSLSFSNKKHEIWDKLHKYSLKFIINPCLNWK